jgi:amino acid adenylation domain-containing protein
MPTHIKLQPQRDMSRTPLVQVVFTIQNTARSLPTLTEIELTPIELDHVTAKFDLTLVVEEQADGLRMLLEYNSDLFLPATIRRMLGNLHTLLESIVADPAQKPAMLPLLSQAERQQLLIDWNATATEYPRDAAIHTLFEAQAAATPNRIALSDGVTSLSYAELNARANRLAHHVQSLGVGPETRVGVYLERSLDLIVALLAILKAGAAYVPLDLAYPAERVHFMLDDAQVALLLTHSDLRDSLPRSAARTVCLDAERATIAAMPASNPACRVGGEHLAYVCYTSGSTGKPKGVSVIQRSVTRLVKNTNYVKLTPAETLLQFAPVAFDAATFEIWGALLNGARLVVFPAQQPSLDELGQFLVEQRITTLWLTAGLFHQMIDYQLPALRGLRQLLAGGDVLSVPHVQRLLAEAPGCRIINGYGPTENTTFTCCYPVTDARSIQRSIPIGRPIANTQVYLLDRQMQPVPIGVSGELYIGGDGLAREYLHRPALTAEKFVPDPFGQPGSRLYRSGDLARFLPDGQIEFLGRIDRQIKLRGFRIELGEIEAALSQHPQVQSCIIMAHADLKDNKQLTAYVVPQAPEDGEDAAQPSAQALREWLGERLPEYMLPSQYMLLDAFPLNANGKIDRAALPRPDEQQTNTAAFVAPRTPVEAVLAALWADTLGLEQVGISDDFFALGGHSLLATQVIAQIRTLFQIDVPLRTLFEAATVAAFAPELIAHEPKPGHAERVAVFLQQMLGGEGED